MHSAFSFKKPSLPLEMTLFHRLCEEAKRRSRLDSPSPFRRAYARHLPRFIGGVYSREGVGLRSISPVLFRWDISLALNMT